MLNKESKRSLRAQAHTLKPVVLIGQHGVTPGVMAELTRALDDHELIRSVFAAPSATNARSRLNASAATSRLKLVGSIGGTAVLYRRNPDKHVAAAPARAR